MRIRIRKLVSFIKKILKYGKSLICRKTSLKKQLEKLSEENERLAQSVQLLHRQSVVSNIMLLKCVCGQHTEQEPCGKLPQCPFPYEEESLAFLKICYLLRDTLVQTGCMEQMRQEYVNTALELCLSRLSSEKDPETRQLIYDALKNEVFDDLELTGYDASFYYDKAAYRQMQEIVERRYNHQYLSELSKPFYEKALVKWYKERQGGNLNLQNPVTYNDKINWMKLHEHDPRKTLYADKFAVRQYVSETIGDQYLIPLIDVWDDVSAINFKKLPNRFVLKATHASGWNIIVPDKSALDIPGAVKRMKRWMQQDWSYRNGLELHYSGIKPRIIAEVYMENSGGELNDYKVWCFNGKAHFVQYIAERHHGLKMAYYDLDWNKLPFISNHEQLESDVERPDNLEELITIAEKLAAGFNHVRVDFYRLNSGEWKFGEMTFTPGGGKLRWAPPEYNETVGALFELN